MPFSKSNFAELRCKSTQKYMKSNSIGIKKISRIYIRLIDNEINNKLFYNNLFDDSIFEGFNP